MVTVWMVFEAVGPEKEGVEKSMEDHVNTLSEDKGVEILETDEEEIKEMEDPHPSIDKGYSKVIETRIEFDSFTKAIETVINYGPTYVQVEGPDSYELKLGESQEMLQEIANTMHQYAQMGAGGVLVSSVNEDS